MGKHKARGAAVISAAILTGTALGYGVHAAATPPVRIVTVTRTVLLTPPSCVMALNVADRRVAAAVDYANTALKVAPLVDDAYKAGQTGVQNPPLLDRINRQNQQAVRTWRALNTATSLAAGAETDCRSRG